MKRPSKQAKHVDIGCRYQPPRFERRHSDGRYEAYMPTNWRPVEPEIHTINMHHVLWGTALAAVLGTVVLIIA